MKRLVLVLAAVAGLAVFVPMAFPSSSPDPLGAQVRALSKQVKELQRRDRQLTLALAHSVDFSACSVAVSADAFQGTWQTIDELAKATALETTFFGPQTPVFDNGVCDRAGIIRSQEVPPGSDVFGALLDSLPARARAQP
jgi:hypothetical protein